VALGSIRGLLSRQPVIQKQRHKSRQHASILWHTAHTTWGAHGATNHPAHRFCHVAPQLSNWSKRCRASIYPEGTPSTVNILQSWTQHPPGRTHQRHYAVGCSSGAPMNEVQHHCRKPQPSLRTATAPNPLDPATNPGDTNKECLQRVPEPCPSPTSSNKRLSRLFAAVQRNAKRAIRAWCAHCAL
jgi:hypothetical protein